MTPQELARILVASRQRRSGRPTQLMPTWSRDNRGISAFELNLRMRRRGLQPPSDAVTRELLDDLVAVGGLRKTDHGWSVIDWLVLERLIKDDPQEVRKLS